MAAPLGLVWLLWGRGHSPGPRLAAVGARPVPLAPSGRRGAWPVPVDFCRAAVGAWPVLWAPCCSRWGVYSPLSPVWPPWGRRRCFAPSGHRGGVAGPLGPVWLPWVRCRSPGLCLAAVGVWMLPWALSGRCVGVATPLALEEVC